MLKAWRWEHSTYALIAEILGSSSNESLAILVFLSAETSNAFQCQFERVSEARRLCIVTHELFSAQCSVSSFKKKTFAFNIVSAHT